MDRARGLGNEVKIDTIPEISQPKPDPVLVLLQIRDQLVEAVARAYFEAPHIPRNSRCIDEKGPKVTK